MKTIIFVALLISLTSTSQVKTIIIFDYALDSLELLSLTVNPNFTMCKLDNGEIVNYDMMIGIDDFISMNWVQDLRNYKMIGKGSVYSIRGILQGGNMRGIFFKDKGE